MPKIKSLNDACDNKTEKQAVSDLKANDPKVGKSVFYQDSATPGEAIILYRRKNKGAQKQGKIDVRITPDGKYQLTPRDPNGSGPGALMIEPKEKFDSIKEIKDCVDRSAKAAFDEWSNKSASTMKLFSSVRSSVTSSSDSEGKEQSISNDDKDPDVKPPTI